MRFIFKYFAAIITLLLSTSVFADINIAVWAPLSEDNTSAGSELMAGAQIAVKELNQEGGLLGEKIKLIPIEDECNDSLTVSTAQMLALNKDTTYKPSAIIGPYCFNQFQKVTDTLAQAKIFQIIPTMINGTYAGTAHSGLIKMVGYKEQQAKDFFSFYNKTFNWMRVALIFDKNNAEIAQAVRDVFQNNGKIEALSNYSFEDYHFDYSDIAEAAFNDDTQMAFILGDAEHVAYMARKLRSNKRNYIIFVNKYQVMPEFENIMGHLIKNCYFMGLPSLKDRPEFTETLVKLRLLGIEPEGLAVYGYSAVQLWAELVKRAHSFEYKKLADSLKDASFDSGWGQLMFTNGNPTNTLSYSIYSYQNGEYTQVY